MFSNITNGFSILGKNYNLNNIGISVIDAEILFGSVIFCGVPVPEIRPLCQSSSLQNISKNETFVRKHAMGKITWSKNRQLRTYVAGVTGPVMKGASNKGIK